VSDLDYDHSTATIFHVNYNIETDAAHVQYFHKTIIPSSNLESSLKKVNIGRIDGFIFADVACDPIVKSLNLSNIRRELYKRFDVKIILPKGEQGKSVDNLLTAAVGKLKSTGEYNNIMGILDTPFNDWQP
jgi:polar amino acid transport system substrate-binding protein